jgi:hypothetical protein
MGGQGLQAWGGDGLQQGLGGGEVAVDRADTDSDPACDVVEMQRRALNDQGTGDGDDPVPVEGRVLA